MLQKIKELFNNKPVDISKKPIPCIECGACCAYFKVEFEIKKNIQVPISSIYKKNNRTFMIGTDKFKGRCKELNGKVGENCLCSIYKSRPDVCDLFSVWLPNGKQNPRCIKAREYHGLIGKIEENKND